MKKDNSRKLYNEAKQYIPGGVNSPVRSFASVGGAPLFVERAKGARITDVDGNSYIDYVCSWGPMILGHAYDPVLDRVRDALGNGVSFGFSTELEQVLARMIVDAFPAMDQVRLVNSGTEATMSALRLARGFTGRDKIVKFDGCYHGHHDSLLVKAGSGLATFGQSSSEGVPASLVKDTISVPYNDLKSLEACFEKDGDAIAAIIVEPVAGNMGLVLPNEGFLEAIRKITKDHGALLIFDEVITGFRIEYGGAQTFYNIEPDITCIGKIIGGGFPVGAYGGRRDIMAHISPVGGVYQAGTLSGNPIAVTAGIATLEILRDGDVYSHIGALGERFYAGLKKVAKRHNLTAANLNSMSCLFFNKNEVYDFNTAAVSDTDAFCRYFSSMQDAGISLPPSQFETLFISYSHTEDDIDATLSAIEKSL